jgi:hypothetical protein
MKILISTLKIIFSILLVLDVFFAGMSHGSGHNIPLKTDIYILSIGVILISILILLSYLGRKIDNKLIE